VNPVHAIPSHHRVGASRHGSGYQPGGAFGLAEGSVDCTFGLSASEQAHLWPIPEPSSRRQESPAGA
jgi:hypothetical protein